jgi:CRISPR/Cas system-associated exonuclease Cas4 (RecB family)
LQLETIELDTLSASKLKTFAACPRKYHYSYLLRAPQTRHPAAAMGTCIHKAIEVGHRDGTDSLSAYNTAWMHEYTNYPELVTDGRSTKSQREGMGILGRYDFAVRQPSAMELEFTLPFPDPIFPVCNIRGYIDQIFSDATIVDLKSSRNRPHRDVLAFDPQFVLYDWAYLNLYGEKARQIIWHHLRTSEDIVAEVRGGPQMDNVERLVDTLLRVLTRARELPVEESAPLFSRNVGDPCGYCSFRTQCLTPVPNVAQGA